MMYLGVVLSLIACVSWGVASDTAPARPEGFVTGAPSGRATLIPQPATPRTAAPKSSGLSSSGLMPASDDSKEILIVQALEQPTSLRIEDAPIGEAIRLLSEKTGVPIEFDRFILGCLPYGSRTMVTATIENRPLRESLTALLNPLAAEYVLQTDKLVIQPRPALFRICRRATWDEVALIQKLYSTPWSRALADSIEFQFQDMSTSDAAASREKIYRLADSVGAGPAARVLELACKQYGWEWYPEGKTIAICTNTRQVERQLQRTVTAQYNEVQLRDVLLDLVVNRAGLELKLEPGVLASLPTHQVERFRMTLENVTVHQALQLVAAETGLAFFVETDGVRFAAGTFAGAGSSTASSTDPAAAAVLRTNPIVGQITIPSENGSTISFFLREQDLPPDVNQLRQQYLRHASNAMRETLSSAPADD